MKQLALATAAIGALALAGCATVNEAAVQALGETQYATLSARSLVGMSGAGTGMANAQISISREADQVCYDLRDEQNLGNVTAFMLHRGSAGANGPMLINFPKSEDGEWKGCSSASSEVLENAIDRSPEQYYVMVHTTQYPNGAIRGQLRDQK